MFEITVDIQGQPFDDAALHAAVQQALLYVQSAWIAAVSGSAAPGMSRPVTDDRYAAALATPDALEYPFNADPFQGRVTMTDPALAQRYETGYKPFDIKPGLLRGKSAKTAKAGHRYAVVPFIHATPGTVGQKGAALPAVVYQVAAAATQGGRVSLLPQLALLGQRSKLPIGGMATPYTWKTGPYAGLVRGGRTGHTTYQTFRTVSDRSDPASWWHPGMPPNPIIASVRDLVAPIVEQVLAGAIGGHAA